MSDGVPTASGKAARTRGSGTGWWTVARFCPERICSRCACATGGGNGGGVAKLGSAGHRFVWRRFWFWSGCWDRGRRLERGTAPRPRRRLRSRRMAEHPVRPAMRAELRGRPAAEGRMCARRRRTRSRSAVGRPIRRGTSSATTPDRVPPPGRRPRGRSIHAHRLRLLSRSAPGTARPARTPGGRTQA